ncbi:MAG: DUF2057 domain-containing protein [Succinivibrionaceae bacterium]|nr:DUF2057 domain-containing protein [Succinivibrionaceae bacterium]
MTIVKKLLAAVAGTVMLSNAVWAGELEIPRPYVLYYLDGGKPSSVFKTDSTVTLTQGPHQVVVRFEGAYRDAGDTKLISAEPVVINMNVPSDDKNYKLMFKYPRSYAKAKEYVKHPTVYIVDEKGDTVDAEIFVLPHRDGLQIGRDYLREIKDLGKEYKGVPGTSTEKRVLVDNANAATVASQAKLDITETVAAETAAKPAAASVTPEQVKSASESLSKQRQAALENLKRIYENADPAVQKEFRVWLVTK